MSSNLLLRPRTSDSPFEVLNLASKQRPQGTLTATDGKVHAKAQAQHVSQRETAYGSNFTATRQ